MSLTKKLGGVALHFQSIITVLQPSKRHAAYLNVFHVCIVQLFSEMLIFLKKINDFPEIAVIVESSVL